MEKVYSYFMSDEKDRLHPTRIKRRSQNQKTQLNKAAILAAFGYALDEALTQEDVEVISTVTAKVQIMNRGLSNADLVTESHITVI